MKKAKPVDVFAAALLVAVTACTSISERQQTSVTTSSPAGVTNSNNKSSQAPSSSKQQTSEFSGLKIMELSAREEGGQTIVNIKLSTPISQYRHFSIAQPPHIVLDVFDDGAPATGMETFPVASSLVGAMRLSYGQGYLRLNIDTIPASVPAYVITPEGSGLKVVVGAPDPKATAKRTWVFVRSGKRGDIASAEGRLSADNRDEISAKEDVAFEAKKYTGQKLSLDFKDADIKNVFRLLADVSGLNIVVTNDVARKVTLRLIEVPWDQALDLLIDTNGLGKEQIGNVVRISTANQLKAERDQLAAAKKAEENLEPLQTVYFNINYAKVKDLEPKVKTLLTKRPDASLVVDDRSNTIMVRDVKKVVDNVTTLIARLDTRTPQVLIESNLIETTPTFARALGNRLTFRIGGTTFSSAAGADTPFTGNNALIGAPPTGLGATISTIQNSVGGFRNLANALEAAEKEGNVRIISRPSVVTLNNVASTIRSERILRIPLPTSTNIASGTGASAAGSAVATEKVPVGIILTVTPQVSSDGFVLLNINVKSSTIADSPTVPSGSGVIPFDELNREAVANVLVRDGETIVLGGILKDTSVTSESGIPYLKDVPVLGWLFKNMKWQKDFEELMVFITPRIASAGSENLPAAEQLWRDQLKKTEGDKPLMTK
jgi:type IV pilus secretin PilQ/predicted competence protein